MILENGILTTQKTLGNLKEMPAFGETSISIFWVCVYNKRNKFNEENLVFADAGNLVSRLLTVTGSLGRYLMAITWRSKVIWEIGMSIVKTPDCFLCEWLTVHTLSFWLWNIIDLRWDPVGGHAYIILPQLCIVGLRYFSLADYEMSKVVFLAAMLRRISWLYSLLMWLLLLWLVFATVPVLDPAGFIGRCGNGLTPSNIDDFWSEPSLQGHKYWSVSLVFGK